MRIAAIDIGTVTSRLFIADVDASGVRPVERMSVITNLGEGVDATGRLSSEAIDRTIGRIAQYRRRIDACGEEGVPVDRVVAVATSASRDAENSADFAARLEGIGITLSVIPGEREAELSFLGAANGYRGRNVAVVDIGGGSTEVVFGRAEGAPDQMVPHVNISARRSFDVGCRRMAERFLADDPPAPRQIADARGWVESEMADFLRASLRACPIDELMAVAGTPTSVVAVRDRLVPYDRERVHGAVVTRDELEKVSRDMCALTLEARMRVPGLQPQRASVFPSGLVILSAVMDMLGVRSFRASEADLLLGIVLDAARGLGEIRADFRMA